jgi:hypothetical protein
MFVMFQALTPGAETFLRRANELCAARSKTAAINLV